MSRSEWTVGLAVVGALIAASFLGNWARQSAGEKCAYDGNVLDPLYRVRMVDQRGVDIRFCCIHCAERWLRQQATCPSKICVIDETTGIEIDASAAHFVRSLVVTNRTTGNRVHAFGCKADAQDHLRLSRGQALEGAARPFATCVP